MELEILERIAGELEALKKLTILSLLGNGYSQAQIAQTLGVSQPTISRMFPGGLAKDRKEPS